MRDGLWRATHLFGLLAMINERPSLRLVTLLDHAFFFQHSENRPRNVSFMSHVPSVDAKCFADFDIGHSFRRTVLDRFSDGRFEIGDRALGQVVRLAGWVAHLKEKTVW